YAQFDGGANSKWNSRNMGILGTIILVFLATHMYNFWWKYHNDQVPYVEYRTELATGETTVQEIQADDFRDYQVTVENNVEIIKARVLYIQVNFSFQNIGIVIFYVLAMAALSFHFIHGFKSSLHSLCVSDNIYVPII